MLSSTNSGNSLSHLENISRQSARCFNSSGKLSSSTLTTNPMWEGSCRMSVSARAGAKGLELARLSICACRPCDFTFRGNSWCAFSRNSPSNFTSCVRNSPAEDIAPREPPRCFAAVAKFRSYCDTGSQKIWNLEIYRTMKNQAPPCQVLRTSLVVKANVSHTKFAQKGKRSYISSLPKTSAPVIWTRSSTAAVKIQRSSY